jgi:uncharacterized membrane protein
VDNEPIIVTLYSKKGDPESEEIRKWIEELNKTDEFKLVIIFPEEVKDFQGKFEDQMPFVQVGPYQLRPPIIKANLDIALKASLDRHKQLVDSRNDQYLKRVDRGRNYSRTDKNTIWITRHYMFLINTLLFLYIAIPFLAPVFMKIGWETAGRAIYTVYKPLCHQFAFRSWFLFGEQAAYPLELAHLHYPITYEDITNHMEVNPLEARNLVGDVNLGYKVALCERDIAIWGSLLITGLVFSASGRKLKRIPVLLWLFLGVLPILFDGGSQFMSSLLPFFPARESTPLLRTISGVLFGTLTGMYMFPLIEESMNDTQQILARKKAVAESKQAG